MDARISGLIAGVAIVGLLTMGCGISEDGENAQDQDEVIAMTMSQFCAGPLAFDGFEVRLTNVTINAVEESTLAGCMDDDHQCCNATWVRYYLDCDGDASVQLVADGEAPWEEVRGEVVDSSETWDEIDALIEGAKTSMGCVGQACYAVCTPGPPESIFEVEGRFQKISVVDLGDSPPPQGKLSVHAVEMAE